MRLVVGSGACALAWLISGCTVATSGGDTPPDPAPRRATSDGAKGLTALALQGPSVTVSPTADVFDGERVLISVTGFGPSRSLEVGECSGHPKVLISDCGGAWWSGTTDDDGALHGTLKVQRSFQAYLGRTIDCDQEGPCLAGVSDGFSLTSVDVRYAFPVTFHGTLPAVGEVRTGSVQLDQTEVVAGQSTNLSASAWAASSRVLVGFCPAGQALDSCWSVSGAVTPEGTYSGSIATTSVIDTGPGLADCTVAGACVVRVADSRDVEHTAVNTPITVRSAGAKGGTATLDLHTPLVDSSPVRVVGSGWTPAHELRVMECQGSGFTTCALLRKVQADSDGAVRVYVEPSSIISRRFVVDCGGSPNGCFLVVADPAALTATAVSIPLTFATGDSVELPSKYEPEYEALFQRGLEISGLTDGDLQRQGAAALVWVMAAGGAKTSTHLSTTGTVTHVTSYGVDDYRSWARLAASYDYTLEELQKAGGLFWSWYLAGMPPIVRPASTER